MSTQPITPAQITFTEGGTPYAPQFGDVYHAAGGALAQAEHVFLKGNGLPERWGARHRFVILETGFGLGNNFLATWAAWRADARRCERLHYVAIEKHPPTRADLQRVHAASPQRDLAEALMTQWPLATPNLHPLAFDGGRVQLLLAFGDIADVLPQLQCEADAFFLDGFAPAKNPQMWTPPLFKRLARLAAPHATAATWSAAQALREGLTGAGFAVRTAPGFDRKRDMTLAVSTPRHSTARPAAFVQRASAGEALVIGAGLAGCAAAHALAKQGWACTVVEREPAPAQAASGQWGGLMHGTFNAPDSLHARWHRAAALWMQREFAPAVAGGAVGGSLNGFLRVESRLTADVARAQLQSVGLPEDYLRWIDATQASEACALPVRAGGWWYPGGGWLVPHDLCAAWLAQAGSACRFMGTSQVARLARDGASWSALDANGNAIASAPAVVLANAFEAAALLEPLGIAALPLSRVRGQTTLLPSPGASLRRDGAPLSNNGYALPLPGDRLLLGATAQPGDDDPTVREADHRHNLAQAWRMGAIDRAAFDAFGARAGELEGRVGWRAVTPDRLPLIGPLVDANALDAARAAGARLDAPAHLPRLHDPAQGLYLLAGLGSRGVTTAMLSAQVLAAWVTGAPCPVEGALRDATDVARFALRARTR